MILFTPAAILIVLAIIVEYGGGMVSDLVLVLFLFVLALAVVRAEIFRIQLRRRRL
jgi:hypothetical protein